MRSEDGGCLLAAGYYRDVPDLAELVEESEVEDVAEAGEEDDAGEAVVLDVAERDVPLVVPLLARGGVGGHRGGAHGDGLQEVHGHLPRVPLRAPQERKVEVGARGDAAVAQPRRLAVLRQERGGLQRVLDAREAGGGVAAGASRMVAAGARDVEQRGEEALGLWGSRFREEEDGTGWGPRKIFLWWGFSRYAIWRELLLKLPPFFLPRNAKCSTRYHLISTVDAGMMEHAHT